MTGSLSKNQPPQRQRRQALGFTPLPGILPVQLSVKVKEPVSGENEASSGTMMLSGEPDCFYTPQGGTVVINGSPGSPDDYAFSGTFDLNFDDPTGAPGCSPHKVAGSFMAPTCAY